MNRPSCLRMRVQQLVRISYSFLELKIGWRYDSTIANSRLAEDGGLDLTLSCTVEVADVV